MSINTAVDEGSIGRPVKQVKGKRIPPLVWLMVAVSGLLVFATVRQLSGAVNLTSSGAIEAAVVAAMPIALAGLSGIWSERAGVVNIGIEGMMVFGTFGAGFAGWQWGPWAGIFFALVCGALGGVLHAVATVTFGVDHIISGVAINIIAPGITLFLAKLLFSDAPGGGQKQSPPVADIQPIVTWLAELQAKDIPVISWIAGLIPNFSNWLATVEAKDIFFASDLAGVIRGSLLGLSLFTLLAIAMIIGSGFILWRTRFGLRLRSCGEEPYAAESLGVNVLRYKFAAVTISGAVAGVAGASLVVGLKYQDAQTGGRGYIGLASMIFGNWRPGGMAMGAGLFGYTDGVRLYDSSGAIHALLLILAVALAAVAIWQMKRGSYTVAGVALALAIASAWWYFDTETLPRQLVPAAPYVITLLVMGLASQNLRMPKADGMIYRKGEH